MTKRLLQVFILSFILLQPALQRRVQPGAQPDVVASHENEGQTPVFELPEEESEAVEETDATPRSPAAISCVMIPKGEMRDVMVRKARNGEPGGCSIPKCSQIISLNTRNNAIRSGLCEPDGASTKSLPASPGPADQAAGPTRVRDQGQANAPSGNRGAGSAKAIPPRVIRLKQGTRQAKAFVDTSTPITADNCMTRYQDLGSLACVACGLQFSGASKVSKSESLYKWISLLGAVARKYQKVDPSNRQAYQKRVVEMVSTYGYCTDSEYLNGQGSHIIMGASLTERQGHSQTIGQMSVSQDITQRDFRKIFGGGFLDVGSIPEAHWRMRAYGHAENFVDRAFGKCMQAIGTRSETNPAFRMCQKPSALPADFPRIGTTAGSLEGIQPAENAQLYSDLTIGCRLPKEERRGTWDCAGQCWGGDAYKSRYLCNKRGRGIPPGTPRNDGDEPSRNRPDRPKQLEEPSRNRRGFEGAKNKENESNRPENRREERESQRRGEFDGAK